MISLTEREIAAEMSEAVGSLFARYYETIVTNYIVRI
jgi:hypothetical protein